MMEHKSAVRLRADELRAEQQQEQQHLEGNPVSPQLQTHLLAGLTGTVQKGLYCKCADKGQTTIEMHVRRTLHLFAFKREWSVHVWEFLCLPWQR